MKEDFEDFDAGFEHKKQKYNRRKNRNCFESDFMEVEELIEDYMEKQKKILREEARKAKTKYFDDWN